MTTFATEDQTNGLQEALEQRRYVWLYEGSRCFMGFVIGLSEPLVLIQRFLDFAENGYAIVRRSAIDEVQCGDRSLKFFEEMMRSEGILERVGLEFAVPLDSVVSALRAIQQQRLLVLFDLGRHEPDDSEFNVGEMLAIDDLHARIRHITAWGTWEERERVIDTPRIERIEFGTPYLKALQKYSPPRV